MKVQENVIKKEAKLIDNGQWTTDNVTTPLSLRLDSKKYAPDAEAFQQWVNNLKPDLFVVIAYGHIMPQWVLDIPVFGSINVHGSLLPEYRGASPLQSVFLDGKLETGITIMKMDA
jgi:methionyl-tRNA formyltransferase